MANHAAGHSLWFNSNGVTASSPGLLGTSYPGLNPSLRTATRFRLASHEHHWSLAATALRLFLRAALSQGRPCGANLGLEAPNAFGVKNSALRSPPATMDRPVSNAVWYKSCHFSRIHQNPTIFANYRHFFVFDEIGIQWLFDKIVKNKLYHNFHYRIYDSDMRIFLQR